MSDPIIVTEIRNIIKKFYDVADDFGRTSLNCPLRDGDDCLAHTITTHCNILDCPIEDVKIDWEAIK